MLHYKNKEGKLIVVYDYDEIIAHKFATTLVQRGYDNVFMLSGGIRVTQIKFPSCLVRSVSIGPLYSSFIPLRAFIYHYYTFSFMSIVSVYD